MADTSPAPAPTPCVEATTVKLFVGNVDVWVGGVLAKLIQYKAPIVRVKESTPTPATSTSKRDDKSKDKDKDGKDKDGADEQCGNEPEDAGPVVNYVVTGSVRSQGAAVPAFVSNVVQGDDAEALQAALADADVVVYNISDSEHEVEEARRALGMLAGLERAGMGDAPAQQFILVSSFMTWCNGPEPDLEDGVLTDDDYIRRRAHAHYASQLACEKATLRAAKAGALKPYVLTAGLLYGQGEGPFHHMFRSAWLFPDRELTVIGAGKNTIPTLHIRDLVSTVSAIIQKKPEQSHYIVCDDSKVTPLELASSVAGSFGAGRTRCIDEEEGFLIPDMSQLRLDALVANVMMESDTPTLAAELGVTLGYAQGPVHHMPSLVEDFLDIRHLTPVRICVTGPPAVGKSAVAARLARYYNVQHVTEGMLVEEGMDVLRGTAAGLDTLTPEDEVEEADKEEWTKRKAEMTEAKAKLDKLEADTGPRKYDESLPSWVAAKLATTRCSVHGYVLDDFPRTEKQAVELFGALPLSAGQQAKLPDTVAVLSATDDFLKERVLNMPEAEFSQLYSAATLGIAPRLEHYHAPPTDIDAKHAKGIKLNADGTQPSGAEMVHAYFATVYSLEEGEDRASAGAVDAQAEGVGAGAGADEPSQQGSIAKIDAGGGTVEHLVAQIQARVGEPRNFGTTHNVSMDESLSARRAAAILAAKQRARRAQGQREAAAPAAVAMSNRNETDGELEEATEPARNYMMQHVLPTLTQALLAVSDAKPADPIAFLSEFLRANTKGPVAKLHPSPWPKLADVTKHKMDLQAKEMAKEMARLHAINEANMAAGEEDAAQVPAETPAVPVPTAGTSDRTRKISERERKISER